MLRECSWSKMNKRRRERRERRMREWRGRTVGVREGQG